MKVRELVELLSFFKDDYEVPPDMTVNQLILMASMLNKLYNRLNGGQNAERN